MAFEQFFIVLAEHHVEVVHHNHVALELARAANLVKLGLADVAVVHRFLQAQRGRGLHELAFAGEVAQLFLHRLCGNHGGVGNGQEADGFFFVIDFFAIYDYIICAVFFCWIF